jgi:MerR family transcriptional regulator, light-induced transcriptional regulator
MTDVRERLEPQRLWTTPGRLNRPEAVGTGDRARSPSRLPQSALVNLTRTIEAEIIPRLLMAHRAEPAMAPVLAIDRGGSDEGQIAALAEQILAQDVEGVRARIEAMRAEGRPLEAIYIQVLAPTASYLRHLWSSDLCGFAEVTLALWRLQQVLREYSVAFQGEGERPETGHRALLVPAPREKHDLSFVMFGLVMMSEFLRRDGWEAWIEPDASKREFAEVVRSQWFDVVEFLVSSDNQLDALASGIRMIRRDSPNRSVGVMVCGQIFIEHPELVLLVGADLTAADATQGALKAENLVRLMASRSQAR